MNIHLEKIELMKLLLETESPSIIQSIREVFKNVKKYKREELSAEQIEELELGQRQIENGEFVDFEDFIKKHI